MWLALKTVSGVLKAYLGQDEESSVPQDVLARWYLPQVEQIDAQLLGETGKGSKKAKMTGS